MVERMEERMPNGPAAAAILSAGLGSAAYGLLTVGAVVSAGLKTALTWWKPTGALSGKTGLGTIIWLVSWIVVHSLWKDKDVPFTRMFVVSLILVGVGLLFTFPPVFEAFEAH